MSKTTILAVLCMLLLFITSCTVSGVDIEQESATGLAGELLHGHSFGQTFNLLNDGLYRIDLYTATYARENTHPVVIKICASTDCQEADVLLRLELPAAQISNSGPTVITFPSITETAGRTLYLSIESPGSIPGNAFTVYQNEKDFYPDGQLYVDGKPTDGDLAFIAYTSETFTIADIWNDFYARASQDKPFFTFYCLLLAVILLALVVMLVWRSKTNNSLPNNESLPPQSEDEGEA